MITKWWDRGNRPITFAQTVELKADDNYRHVRRDIIHAPAELHQTGVLVSTIWVGADMGNHPIGTPPLIFETMIIGGAHDGQQWRSATEAEAIVRHNRAVDTVKRDLGI